MFVRVPFFSPLCKQLELTGWVVMEVNDQGSALLHRLADRNSIPVSKLAN